MGWKGSGLVPPSSSWERFDVEKGDVPGTGPDGDDSSEVKGNSHLGTQYVGHPDVSHTRHNLGLYNDVSKTLPLLPTFNKKTTDNKTRRERDIERRRIIDLSSCNL